MSSEELRIFSECLSVADSADNAVQLRVMQTIEQFRMRPDLYRLLLRLFAGEGGCPSLVRQRAGLLLKTALLTQAEGRQDPQVVQTVLDLLTEEAEIRKVAASVAACLVELNVSRDFIIDHLAKYFQVSEGALAGLGLVVEDQVGLWRRRSMEVGTAVANTEFGFFLKISHDRILPGLFTLLASPSGTAGSRAKLLKLVNSYLLNFLCISGGPLSETVGEYLKMLGFQVGTVQLTPRDQMEVAKGFSYLAAHHPEQILPAYAEISVYMLSLGQSAEYEVRLHALEFWSAVAMADVLLEMSRTQGTLLDQVVRVLMENMVYSKADYEMMDEAVWAADDASVPDRDEALEPRFHAAVAGSGEAGEDEGEAMEEEEEEEGGNLWGESWTARKAAARSLDGLGVALGGEMLDKVLPLLEIALGSGNWQISEAGILALGAISSGECLEELAKRGLKNVIGNFLLKFLVHEIPLVRSITLWTLGRLASFVVFESEICGVVVAGVLRRMEDKNKAVQQAAVTTVSSCVEAGGLIGNFAGELSRSFARCVSKYQTRNLVTLLDAAANLIDSIAQTSEFRIMVGEVVGVFLASETRKQLFIASGECLCSVLGSAPEILEIDQLAKTLEKAMMVLQIPRHVDPDVLAVSIDILASAVAANAPVAGELVGVVVGLGVRLETSDPDSIKQSIMALLGDLFKKAIDHFQPENLYQLVPVALDICRSGNFQAANNAIWALGELANQRSLGNFVRSVAEICVEISSLEKSRPLLRQNACITFGRLGKFAASELVACPAFNPGLEISGAVMAKIPTDPEKISGAIGILSAVLAKKTAAGDLRAEEISASFRLLGAFFPAPAEIKEAGKVLIGNLRTSRNFQVAMSTLPTDLLFKLKQSFPDL